MTAPRRRERKHKPGRVKCVLSRRTKRLVQQPAGRSSSKIERFFVDPESIRPEDTPRA